MPSFGKRSTKNLDTLHPDLQTILRIAIQHVDFAVLEGFRDKDTQNKYFDQGKSKIQWPKGKHNQIPSLAVDIAPWKIDWNDIKRFGAVAFFIKGIAISKGIKIRLGADWNGDFEFNESFVDAPHIELHSKLINDTWVKY